MSVYLAPCEDYLALNKDILAPYEDMKWRCLRTMLAYFLFKTHFLKQLHDEMAHLEHTFDALIIID